jgi:Ca-activated chloride channel family protein
MHLLFPAGLLLGALAVPLTALYFLKLRRRRVVVPSLLPWHALRRTEQLMSPFQRFRRNLLLLLQLLVLAVLVAAFARPYVEDAGAPVRSLVLVVDRTASMGARSGSGTRFEEAVRQARGLVAQLSAGDEALVLSAGATTEVVQPFTRDRAALDRALRALAVTDSPGSLEPALTLATSLSRSRDGVEIVVLSDGGATDLSSVPVDAGVVRYQPIGEGGDRNAGIVALDLRRSPSAELERQLFVTVKSFGGDAVPASIEVYVGSALHALRAVTLQPEVSESVVFDLPADLAGDLEVRLEAPGDLLPTDDVAHAVLAPFGSRDVVLVGADPLVARVLAADPRVRARVVDPAEATPEVLRAADCAVFAGPVPDGVDGLAYAVLGPWPGSPVTFGEPVRSPRITGWQRTHPTLRHTQWDDVFVGEARRVVDGGGLAAIVDGDAGPLVLAGVRHGARVAQLAFDPARSDLPLRVAWPLWILDTVGWLTEDLAASGDALVVRTGSPFVRSADRTVPTARVSSPGGVRTVPVSDGLIRVPEIDRVGVWEVSAGVTRHRFAANLLSEAESRIRPRTSLGLQRTDGTVIAEARLGAGRRELWRPFLLVVLGLLVVEWLFWNLRRVA